MKLHTILLEKRIRCLRILHVLVAGFGLPKPGSDLPTPVLFAMTDMENKDSNAANLKRKFSFFSTDTVCTASFNISVLYMHMSACARLHVTFPQLLLCVCDENLRVKATIARITCCHIFYVHVANHPTC